MATLKVNELLDKVEQNLAQKTQNGYRLALLDASKILYRVLSSKGYPGRSIERKLYYAGYSLKEKNGIADALKKHKEALEVFDLSGSDLEIEEAVKAYKKVIYEVATKPALKTIDKVKVFIDIYLNPKSLIFWRNITILFGSFAAIKLLAYTEIGKKIVEWVVTVANFAISWMFVIAVIVIVIAALLINSYFANRTKVKIKE